MVRTNYIKFNLEEQKKGLHTKFIETLLEYNRTSTDGYFEILITPAGYEDTITIEFIQNYYDRQRDRHDNEDHFKAVGPDDHIMFEYQFPDDHFEWVESIEEGEERVEEWLKNNPGWIKTGYGRWINKEENERLRKEFGLDDPDWENK